MLALLLAAAGCADDAAPREPADLVAAPTWAFADEADDMFADQRPAESECDPLRATTVEASRFEINTGWCNYATVTQPIRADLLEGDEVEVRIFHFELIAPEPALGYMGVALDEDIVWEGTKEIPSESGLIVDTFTVDHDIEVGTLIQFHLHNHGKNSWQVVSLTRL